VRKTSIALLAAGAIGLATLALLADDHEERDDEGRNGEYFESRGEEAYRDRKEPGNGAASAALPDPGYTLYKAECAGCHIAYPPSLLPAASWRATMGALQDHFGENAEIDMATADRIMSFLDDHAAAKGTGTYGERTWRATVGRAPMLRITETDYFRGQHHEIPERMVIGNPQVGSFSRCEACHAKAELGNFDEHRVRIPGYGRWDD
jgi:hypothetical protein